MCVIIDANLAPRIFNVPTPPEFRPLLRWIYSERGGLVFGGLNMKELFRIKRARHAIKELRRHHRAIEILGTEAEQSRIEADLPFVSDDPHIIALARLSNARTLCSEDNDLHSDFKNLKLIPRPKGRIYQNQSHVDTLVHTKQCPFGLPT